MQNCKSCAGFVREIIPPELNKYSWDHAIFFAKRRCVPLRYVGIVADDSARTGVCFRSIGYINEDLKIITSVIIQLVFRVESVAGMQQQTIIVLLLGLAVSTYGLDLSHAKRSAALEPRVANFIGDLYTQVIFPPLKDIVTKLAALVAEIVARVSQIGVLSADGRRVHPSDEQLRGFFSGLWNEALKPPLENTIQNIALLAAQVLAGIGSNGINLGIGKRDLTEEEMRGFFSGLWNEALKPPLENTLQNVALLAAQVLAGIGSNGINLGIGKRDLTEEEMRGFLDSLGQAVNDVYANVLQKPIENALSNGALMLAQVLAGLGTNGISLSGLLGKRDVDFSGREDELRGIFSSVTGAVVNGLAGVWNNIFQAPLETFVQNGALTAAGWLANLATEGVNLG
ncbi:unnamed protein product [Adineta ricciae]|uniref:Uncharacterized protein n=1 Tax=Adineta ricciae TaxID=249248 RepID=A0A813QZE4_ADIRI|nr:unnamed protein product [Adineta ricciae]